MWSVELVYGCALFGKRCTYCEAMRSLVVLQLNISLDLYSPYYEGIVTFHIADKIAVSFYQCPAYCKTKCVREYLSEGSIEIVCGF